MDPPPDLPVPARRFQTRRGVQRTSKADREAFVRAEEQRQAEARCEAERAASAAARGSYIARGRGRGPQRGNAAERIRAENSAGVFGAAVPAVGVGAGRGRGAARGRSGVVDVEDLVEVEEEALAEASREGETLGTRTDAAQLRASIGDGEIKPTTTSANATIERKKLVESVKDSPLVLSSDEEGLEEDGRRRDIETIEISSDEEDDPTDDGDDNEGPVSAIAKGKRRENRDRARAPRAKMALRPVRARREPRQMHEWDGSSSRKKMQRSLRDRSQAHGGNDEIGGALVDDEVMDVDEPGPSTDFSLQGIDAQTKSSRKKGLSAKDKDPKLGSETIEERAERIRYSADVRKIRCELSALHPVMAPSDDFDMTEAAYLDREIASGREGRIYLFQFPPLTPMLVDPAHKDDVVEIKQEPGAEGTQPGGAAGAGAGTGGSPVQSSTKSQKREREKPSQIKKEDNDLKEEVKAQIAAAAENAKILTADGARLPPGFAGKLNVHKSGKVTLEWGETNMEVRWGSEVDFLQDVVLAAGDDSADVKEGGEKNAFALGQVRKKFVVIPDWQKIYE
jgi:DNA-directed RNA polymerase III subunit RPC4